jgi:membrane protein YdbS with pleckstrin-like domain
MGGDHRALRRAIVSVIVEGGWAPSRAVADRSNYITTSGWMFYHHVVIPRFRVYDVDLRQHPREALRG